jgi:hypothetical protein
MLKISGFPLTTETKAINPLYGGKSVAVAVGSTIVGKGVAVKVGVPNKLDNGVGATVPGMVDSGCFPIGAGSNRWIV